MTSIICTRSHLLLFPIERALAEGQVNGGSFSFLVFTQMDQT